MRMKEYYARSANSDDAWEPLPVHLEKTAKLASQYASAFGEETAGAYLGWYYDAGKLLNCFKVY